MTASTFDDAVRIIERSAAKGWKVELYVPAKAAGGSPCDVNRLKDWVKAQGWTDNLEIFYVSAT